MGNSVEFARRLKTQRRKMGLTQAQLGEMIGVSSQSISAYEKNTDEDSKKLPVLDTAMALADALDVSIEYLWGTTTTVETNKGTAAYVRQLLDAICNLGLSVEEEKDGAFKGSYVVRFSKPDFREFAGDMCKLFAVRTMLEKSDFETLVEKKITEHFDSNVFD